VRWCFLTEAVASHTDKIIKNSLDIFEREENLFCI